MRTWRGAIIVDVVSNPTTSIVEIRRSTSYFDYDPVCYWFACLLVPLTDVTGLTSVLTVSTAALLVCYFNLCSFRPFKA
jgi:hypothetical protein